METHPHHVVAVFHLAGFLCGLALYGMLFVLAVRARGSATGALPERTKTDHLAVLTGIFGVIWNAGAMVVHGLADFGLDAPPPALAAATYAALGFLPAVVAHSIVRPAGPLHPGRPGLWLVAFAYILSGCAAVLHAGAALRGMALPSGEAFRLLTAGYALLTLPLLAAVHRQALWRRALVVAALGVFGVTAIHLVEHQDFTSPLWVQVLGHHASLPLAVAILLQDYPFAFGDLLLKRMLSLGALVTLTLAGFFAIIRLPLVAEIGSDLDRPEFVGVMVLLVMANALAYPCIRAAVGAIVDRLVLRRADPAAVLAALTRLSAEREHVDALLADGGAVLTTALSAAPIAWDAGPSETGSIAPASRGAPAACEASARIVPVSLDPSGRTARIVVPTADSPCPTAVIGPLAGGRRFLAADVALLRDGALVLARRIDAIRIGHERFDRRWREEEMARLAVDAELRALRAQINPHFLFNALTTIGYLVKTAPDQALHTLLRLTEVLRRALRPDEDVVTLASELQLVDAYLDIERARFEERLRVTIDVPEDLKHLRIPSFVLQPLVENAVKHGIAPSRTGGLVSVRARLGSAGGSPMPAPVLELTVADTRTGRTSADTDHNGQGVGLANVRRRLELAYGAAASLRLTTDRELGTQVVVTIPCPRPGTDRGQGQETPVPEERPS